MNHAITIGGLLLTLGFVASIILAGLGAVAVFAGGMSDAPEAGSGAEGVGCTLLIVGAALFALCFALAVF